MTTKNHPLHFNSKLEKIDDEMFIRIPQDESMKLPSRGLVAVEGTINGLSIHTILEPDGARSHYLSIDDTLKKTIKADVGDTVLVDITPSDTCPEPEVPDDIQKEFSTYAHAQKIWNDITPMARWDWIRWIRATKNPETRKKRIAVALDKFKKGVRRPCCFNRNMCTDPLISKNGVLLNSTL